MLKEIEKEGGRRREMERGRGSKKINLNGRRRELTEKKEKLFVRRIGREKNPPKPLNKMNIYQNSKNQAERNSLAQLDSLGTAKINTRNESDWKRSPNIPIN